MYLNFFKQLMVTPLELGLDDVAMLNAKVVPVVRSKGDLAMVVLQMKPALLAPMILVLMRLNAAMTVNA